MAGCGDGFIVQKNNPKINRELKAKVVVLLRMVICHLVWESNKRPAFPWRVFGSKMKVLMVTVKERWSKPIRNLPKRSMGWGWREGKKKNCTRTFCVGYSQDDMVQSRGCKRLSGKTIWFAMQNTARLCFRPGRARQPGSCPRRGSFALPGDLHV